MEKQRHTVIPRTSCLVFNGAGQVLLIKFSAKKGKMEGFFDPPGGHIEYGEGVIECAQREIKEETGLEVKNTVVRGIIHATNFFEKNIMLFITSSLAVTLEPKPSSEGTPVWVDPTKLDELKIFEDIKKIITHITNPDEKTFFTAKSEFDDDGKMISWEFENSSL